MQSLELAEIAEDWLGRLHHIEEHLCEAVTSERVKWDGRIVIFQGVAGGTHNVHFLVHLVSYLTT